jgi:hypothetical protein
MSWDSRQELPRHFEIHSEHARRKAAVRCAVAQIAHKPH